MNLFFLIHSLLFAQDPELQALSNKLDELYRATSSRGKISMTVTTPHYTRKLTMKVWSRGMDYTLVRIESPRKEKGVATLKRKTEMWNYLPKIKKLIRIPPSMMMGSWMGSDFTNDDLMRESSWAEDYHMSRGPAAEGVIHVIFTPKPDAPVTWQKVTVIFDAESQLPMAQSFYDEKGRHARTLTFDRVMEMDGRMVPTRITLTPLLKKGRITEVIYTELEFDVALETSFFSKSQLQKGS